MMSSVSTSKAIETAFLLLCCSSLLLGSRGEDESKAIENSTC